jgi:hypothetical protein
MRNYPASPDNATFVSDNVESAYSLDNQCRMEFGEGFQFCSSFKVRRAQLMQYSGLKISSTLNNLSQQLY